MNNIDLWGQNTIFIIHYSLFIIHSSFLVISNAA